MIAFLGRVILVVHPCFSPILIFHANPFLPANTFPFFFWFFVILLFIIVLLQLSHWSPIALPFLTHLHSDSQSPPCCTCCPQIIYTCSLTRPFPFFLPYLTPAPLWSLSVCSLFPCLWFHFTCLFCSLGSWYRWDHMVFVFHCLSYFT